MLIFRSSVMRCFVMLLRFSVEIGMDIGSALRARA